MDSNREKKEKHHLVGGGEKGTARDGSLMGGSTGQSTGQGSVAGYDCGPAGMKRISK